MTVIERAKLIDNPAVKIALEAAATHRGDPAWAKDDTYSILKTVVSRSNLLPGEYQEVLWAICKEMDY